MIIRSWLHATAVAAMVCSVMIGLSIPAAGAQQGRDLRLGATVLVRTQQGDRRGGGIIVGAKPADAANTRRYYILTAMHVSGAAGEIRVQAHPEAHVPHRARVFRVAPELDVALLELDVDASRFQAPAAPSIPVALSPGPNQPIQVVGHVGGFWREAASSTRASTNADPRVFHITYVAGEVDVGSSGGSVFDGSGRLLGMVTSRSAADPASVRVVGIPVLAELVRGWGLDPNLLVPPEKQLLLQLDQPQRVADLLGNMSPDQRDSRGSTALMLAAQRGLVPTMQALLRSGAAAGAQDQEGQTALFYAASAGSLRAVEVLLAAGADPNHRNESGETPLFAAVGAMAFSPERPAIVEHLLQRGANPNLTARFNRTALIAAARSESVSHLPPSQHSEAAGKLLASKADPNQRYERPGHDDHGRTALHWAAGQGFPDTMRVLLQYGARVDATDEAGSTPLMQVAAAEPSYDHSGIGSPSCWDGPDLGAIKARMLLEAKADPNLRDKQGRTAKDLVAARTGTTPGAMRCRKCMLDTLEGRPCRN